MLLAVVVFFFPLENISFFFREVIRILLNRKDFSTLSVNRSSPKDYKCNGYFIGIGMTMCVLEMIKNSCDCHIIAIKNSYC